MAAARTAFAAVNGFAEGVLELPAERKNQVNHAATRGGNLTAERLQLLLQADDAAHIREDSVSMPVYY